MSASIVFHWGVSSFFGWGVYGYNLMKFWPFCSDGKRALTSMPLDASQLAGIDPIERLALKPSFDKSIELQKMLSAQAGKPISLSWPVLHGLGNRLVGDRSLTGSPTIGVVFFEDTELGEGHELAKTYPLIVTGSHWNEEVLRGNGISEVATVLQGVDTTAFHPAPRAGLLADRFTVFSGGKLEYRKGQDLTLLAFRAFAARHPEALLVTAWHSPWPELARSVEANPAIAPVRFTPEGRLDVRAWAAANGLRPEQVLDLGAVPNTFMPRILREMDVALFPNRCEGGTNLVAMECMACGIPVILSDNSGHKDLTALGAPYPLRDQRKVAPLPGLFVGTEGWGESQIGEIVGFLDEVWMDREKARRKAAAGAEALAALSWSRQIAVLEETIRPYLGSSGSDEH
jgi:glycosyltransferase involved in cell wall biosynthesis